MEKPTKHTKADVKAKAAKLKTQKVHRYVRVPNCNLDKFDAIVNDTCKKYGISRDDIRLGSNWGIRLQFKTDETEAEKESRAADLLFDKYWRDMAKWEDQESLKQEALEQEALKQKNCRCCECYCRCGGD